jgi:cell division transport system permease protein
VTLAWLFASPAERRLLPGGRFRGPTPFVIAIMTFAMMTVAAAGLALSNAAGLVAQGIENRYAVQIPAGSRLLPRALAAARSAPGVAKAEPVPEAEMRKTLERWLGPAGVDDQLPVPALITLDIAGNANLAAIAARVEAAAPGARVIAHQEVLEPLLRAIRVLKWLALSLVALMAAATSAAVVLAARGALDTHRSTIEVMHGIGATDLQVTHLFQRKIALDSLAGAVAGAVAASLVLLLLAGGGTAFAGDLMGTSPLRGSDLVLLALLPLAVVVLATWVARTAVLAALRGAT